MLPVKEIGALIARLTNEQASPARGDGPHVRAMEPDLGPPQTALDAPDRPGKVSVFTCPECHGTLWEADERGIVRFRCRVGHVYSPESMLSAQTDSVDRALWIALRSLEERAALTHRMADLARSRKHIWVAKAFEQRALAAEEHAAVVRDLLTNRMTLHEVPDTDPETPLEQVTPVNAGGNDLRRES